MSFVKLLLVVLLLAIVYSSNNSNDGNNIIRFSGVDGTSDNINGNGLNGNFGNSIATNTNYNNNRWDVSFQGI